VTIHTMFPMTLPLILTNEVALETLLEMRCLVVGGTMSTSAFKRSYNVSSADSSEEIDDKDSWEEWRDEEVEA